MEETLSADPIFEALSDLQQIKRDFVEDPHALFLSGVPDMACKFCFPLKDIALSDLVVAQEEVPEDSNMFFFAQLDFSSVEQVSVDDIVDFRDVEKIFPVRKRKTPVPPEVRATDRYKKYREKNNAAARLFRHNCRMQSLEKIRAELRLEVMSLTEERNNLLFLLRSRLRKANT